MCNKLKIYLSDVLWHSSLAKAKKQKEIFSLFSLSSYSLCLNKFQIDKWYYANICIAFKTEATILSLCHEQQTSHLIDNKICHTPTPKLLLNLADYEICQKSKLIFSCQMGTFRKLLKNRKVILFSCYMHMYTNFAWIRVFQRNRVQHCTVKCGYCDC